MTAEHEKNRSNTPQPMGSQGSTTVPDEPGRPPSPVDVERQFLDAERRARRYWYEDGLGEMAVGAVFVFLGAYFTAQAFLAGRMGRTTDVLFNLLFPVIVIGGALGVRVVIGRLKERLVYPRAGYATYPQARRLPKWVTGSIAGAIAGLVAVLARSAPGIDALLPAFQGFLMAVFLWWLGRLSGLPRFPVLGLACAAIGVAVSLLRPASTTMAGALFFGPVGAALVLSGLIAFRRFLGALDAAGDR